MSRIKRKYLDEVVRTIGTEDIKVITGVRRSGKSILLDDFKKYAKSNIENTNIISFDLSSLKYEKLREYHALNDYVEEPPTSTISISLGLMPFLQEVTLLRSSLGEPIPSRSTHFLLPNL